MKVVVIIVVIWWLISMRKVRIPRPLIPIIRRLKSGIPKLVYRTSYSRELPRIQVSNCHQKWCNLNPDYTMIWFDEKEQQTFMHKYFQGEVERAYRCLRPGAFKCDLWRLCVLYQFGGIYIDAYSTPEVSFAVMLKYCEDYSFISVLDDRLSFSGIHNGVIMATKGHPFLKAGIDDIVRNVQRRYYGFSWFCPTGPISLSNAIRKCTGKTTPHQEGDNGSYYLFTLRRSLNQNVYDKTTLILRKKFSFWFHTLQRLQSKSDYATLWKQRRVYENSPSDSLQLSSGHN